MKTLVKTFKNKVGATAIEYGLIAALISVGIITAVGTVGTNLNATFNKVSANLVSSSSTTGTTGTAGAGAGAGAKAV